MKIKSAHFEHMRHAILATIDRLDSDRLAEHKTALANDPRVKDCAKRYRWDLFHAAGLARFACDELYAYANDDHIDTALRAIVRA